MALRANEVMVVKEGGSIWRLTLRWCWKAAGMLGGCMLDMVALSTICMDEEGGGGCQDLREKPREAEAKEEEEARERRRRGKKTAQRRRGYSLGRGA